MRNVLGMHVLFSRQWRENVEFINCVEIICEKMTNFYDFFFGFQQPSLYSDPMCEFFVDFCDQKHFRNLEVLTEYCCLQYVYKVYKLISAPLSLVCVTGVYSPSQCNKY